ncbi:cytochrome c553 [Methylopila capsulata]|uniref:Cytochrome c n=1 Tax=Methylopila capsulata TaxID=61654 RepID=A0A9W6IW51_9HYPH|nr:c-type cytochrome [Methylopila capsulata]MBM7852173.1 cytochrome c553 [Methylopila capsulata]GLK56379.1 cytochrome c [Methylopila capsulata]
MSGFLNRGVNVRVTPKRAGIAAVAAVAAGLAFGWSGLFNISASTKHWPVTDWFLHWVMINSVETWSIGVEVPDNLDDRALIARGAGHYATGCASCHGAPGRPRSPLTDVMSPPPPDLDAKVPTWETAHLFTIVKHGVKFSGMPAWVSFDEREDEVWSVVAFLKKLPGMTPDEYKALAMGAETDGAVGGLVALAHGPQGRGPREDTLADCARCHGRDGLGRDGDAFPVIAGQSEDYLFDALSAYAVGKRHSGIMQPAAARLPYSELAALAEHYANQPAARPKDAPTPDPALVATGETIAREGVRATGTPACQSCHGPSAAARNPAYPSLAGQHASYLETQLHLWEKEHDSRGGGPFREIMRKVAFRLTPEEIRAVAAYYASLPPGK